IADMGGYVFRCMIGGECGDEVVSGTTTLVIKNGASVKTQRDTQVEICEGGAATIVVEAADATSYQWQVDRGGGFDDLMATDGFDGVASPELSIVSAVAEMDGYVFRCRVGGECGEDVFSYTSTLIIKNGASVKT